VIVFSPSKQRHLLVETFFGSKFLYCASVCIRVCFWFFLTPSDDCFLRCYDAVGLASGWVGHS